MCGILGIWSQRPFYRQEFVGWLRALRHRGQETAGIVWDAKEVNAWDPSHAMAVDGSLVATSALGHARYSTAGGKAKRVEGHIQPLVAPRGDGVHVDSLVHNGNVARFVEAKGDSTDTFQMWRWLREEREKRGGWEAALRALIEEFHGAFSLVIDAEEGIFVARDRHGVRPLWVAFDGRTSTYMAFSETCAVPHKEGWRDVPPIQVRPGEIRYAKRDGRSWKRLWRFVDCDPKFCSFEWIYFQHHTSSNVYGYRYELGEALAADEAIDTKGENTIVACMPRTAIPMAAGFADALGLVFMETAVQKAPDAERTFILPTPEAREEACKAKFIYDRDILQGATLFLVDDSLVRGNTMGTTLKRLWAEGVKEIHVRIASPPVSNPCDKGIDIPTKEELIWNDVWGEGDLAGRIGCTSLRYLSVEALKTVVGSKVCTYCFTGVQAWSDAF